MILTEHEAKLLLEAQGVPTPKRELLEIAAATDFSPVSNGFSYPAMVKAQVLHGNRAQQHLVFKVTDDAAYTAACSQLLHAHDQFGSPITHVTVEECVESSRLCYLALLYDTGLRKLVAQYSSEGGVGMDDRGATLITTPLSAQTPPSEFPPAPELLSLLQKVWHVFTSNDAVLLEINPAALVGDTWMCLDCKLELEDVAQYRHPEWQAYPVRSALGRAPTAREEQAHAVSRSDHRGVAGESFFEFSGGTFGVLASGGGASTLVMDALLAEGLRPANYTEYSGNPTREKVAALTRVVLSIPNLHGLFVVGSNANFTDIYETVGGVLDGLLETAYVDDPHFVVYVRRGGPRWQEAFDMVKERLAGKACVYELQGPDFPLVQTAQAFKALLLEHE